MPEQRADEREGVGLDRRDDDEDLIEGITQRALDRAAEQEAAAREPGEAEGVADDVAPFGARRAGPQRQDQY